ncbi:MAG TPA: NAD-dependent epimerase/dehydratase family protein [Acidimicrobiales bacterium]|nr:NAD-dependent epimerase/dehydratase family protein [Acidimicrobiales bacterium]
MGRGDPHRAAHRRRAPRLRGRSIDVGLTGATGALGSRLLPLLLADPDVSRVRSVARRPLAVTDPKLVHTQADLRDPAARSALKDVDVLWHLGFQLWRAGSRNELGDVNIVGTRNVLDAGPARVVFASSASVYGAWPDNPLPLAESDLARPNVECPYAAQKLEAEGLCAAAAPTISLRIAAVLGDHSDPQVRKAAARYKMVVPAVKGVRQALQFLDEDDVAAALHCAGTSDATGVFNVATDDWLAETDIASIAGSRILRLPLRLTLGVAEVAARARFLPFGADRACMLNGPLALSPKAAEKSLGWKPTKTSTEVLREFLAR